MKAIVVHQFGGIDALAYEDTARPVAGDNQVLVQVKAAGVGPWDVLIRTGRSALNQPLPVIPGSDISGLVVTPSSLAGTPSSRSPRPA